VRVWKRALQKPCTLELCRFVVQRELLLAEHAVSVEPAGGALCSRLATGKHYSGTSNAAARGLSST
jgi:hypothetical protein